MKWAFVFIPWNINFVNYRLSLMSVECVAESLEQHKSVNLVIIYISPLTFLKTTFKHFFTPVYSCSQRCYTLVVIVYTRLREEIKKWFNSAAPILLVRLIWCPFFAQWPRRKAASLGRALLIVVLNNNNVPFDFERMDLKDNDLCWCLLYFVYLCLLVSVNVFPLISEATAQPLKSTLCSVFIKGAVQGLWEVN